MIRKTLLVTILFLGISVITKASEEKYGKEISLKEKSSVSAILAEPEKYNGKPILVEGTIVGVCQEKGCWIDIAGEKENEKIKVKVEDGVIIFPKDSKGKTALVEGVLVPVSSESCDAEHAKKKESGEEESCCSMNKKAKVYQVQGLGAVIK